MGVAGIWDLLLCEAVRRVGGQGSLIAGGELAGPSPYL